MNEKSSEIGFCNARPETAEKIVAANRLLRMAIGEPVALRHLPGLAGPNDLVQLLLDNVQWISLAFLLQGFLNGFMGQAGIDAYEKLKGLLVRKANKTPPYDPERTRALIELYAALEAAEKLGNTITLGFTSTKGFMARNVGIQVTPISPEKFARAILHLANSSDLLEQAIGAETSPDSAEKNDDCSQSIKEAADGSLSLTYICHGRERVTLKVSPEGRVTRTVEKLG